jgi:hypothetical protein
VCLCHVCSEIRDVWKKTGAWFYKGIPNYDLSEFHQRGIVVNKNVNAPNCGGGSNDRNNSSQDQSTRKLPKTTKLGMEIESDEDDDEIDNNPQHKDDTRIFKNGSFSSSFLRNRNLFNLRLSTDSNSRLTIDSSSNLTLPKKSPVTPLYSRQTSSSDSQKSANSLQNQPQNDCWDSATGKAYLIRLLAHR